MTRQSTTQALYDVLWTARELRKRGYTMQTAITIGKRDLYAQHGSQGLARWLDVATDCALHNAEQDGIAAVRHRATCDKS